MNRWTSDEVAGFVGEKVVDDEGHQIGKVTQVTDRPGTLDPEWLVVKTSMFGKESLVPLDAVEGGDDIVHVPFSKATIKSAPHPLAPLSLSDRERNELVRYYEHVD